MLGKAAKKQHHFSKKHQLEILGKLFSRTKYFLKVLITGHTGFKGSWLSAWLIKKGAKKLEGTHDYSTFRASSCHAKSPIKTIKSVKIKSTKNRIEIQFRSQSFLQQQVRSMVGCLKYLGERKWDLKTFDKIFKSKKRVYVHHQHHLRVFF